MKGRNRLASLRDMLLTYSKAFAMACADLEMTRGAIARCGTAEGMVTLNSDHRYARQLKSNIQQLNKLGHEMPSISRIIPPLSRLLAEVDADPDIRRITQLIESLQLAIFDELDRHVYYHVEEGLVPYYNLELPFGDEVFQKFPSATDDIRNAGRCIALGQGTAAVFHLMLVLKLGLAAVAKGLEIPYAPSWESYLRQINSRMSQTHATKKPSWKKVEAFYRDVAGDLQLVKVAWRNPTMHIVRGRSYDISDAEAIYKATRTLMQRLATKLKEPTRRPPASIGPIQASAESA